MLKVTDVSKHFYGLNALEGVNLEIDQGEIMGLIGPNGSGKTTLVNIIAGVFPASTGKVIYKDENLNGLPSYKRALMGIGRTFQILHLFRGISVRENVLIGYSPNTKSNLFSAIFRTPLHRHDEAVAMAKAEELLDLVGLSDKTDQMAGELTSGQARLLDLARTLATGADFLLLDEPASGLNTAETFLLEGKLKKINEQGITMLLIEHDTRLVFSLCNRVVVLDHGVVIAKGTPEEVRKDKGVIEAYLGTKA